MQTNGTIIKDYSISMGRQKVCTAQSLSYFSEASKVGFFFFSNGPKGRKFFILYILYTLVKNVQGKRIKQYYLYEGIENSAVGILPVNSLQERSLWQQIVSIKMIG